MRTLYLNPSKSEKEGGFFETFLRAKNDLNIQNPRKGNPPEPDYIFSLPPKEIGLEITSPVQEPLAKIRDAQDKCLTKATQIAEQDGLEIVKVQVEFRSNRDPINIDEAAKELVNFVKDKIPKVDGKKSCHCYESGLKYSRWISIQLGTVNGHKWLKHHWFRRIHINWMRTNLIDEIQAIINKKQYRYHQYIQSCDECWLLIGVNEWTAPEAVAITDELESHVFSGDFQRLFFLRNIENVLVELNISPKQSS